MWLFMLIHEKNWLFPQNGKLGYASLKLMCSPGSSFCTILIEKRLGMLSNSPDQIAFAHRSFYFKAQRSQIINGSQIGLRTSNLDRREKNSSH